MRASKSASKTADLVVCATERPPFTGTATGS
jgi:hypothetical protein